MMHTLERFLGAGVLLGWTAKLDEDVKLNEVDEGSCDGLTTACCCTLAADEAQVGGVANELVNEVCIPAAAVGFNCTDCFTIIWALTWGTAVILVGAAGLRTTFIISFGCVGGGVREPSEELEASDVEMEIRDRFLIPCALTTICCPLAEWERVENSAAPAAVKERFTPLLGEVECSCCSCCWNYRGSRCLTLYSHN